MGHQLIGLDNFLHDAITISLFTDKFEPTQEDPSGWWADSINGHSIGSHLWLLAREKQTLDNLRKAEDYARNGLKWLIEDGLVEKMDITANYEGNSMIILIKLFVENTTESFNYEI